MVCDESSSNRSAIKRLGIALENPSFTFEGNDIFFGFDVPHMFKGIRNILLNNNFTVNGNIVSWLPIKQLYELEKDKSCKAAHKLTERHIQPKAFEKMKVSLAVQVFSHSVGTALMTVALNKEIGLNTADFGIAAETFDFCTRLNRIFDCLNARSFNDPNRYRKSLSKSTRVEDELKKAVDWIKTIVDESRSPVFPTLLLTINGILLLWDRLKSKDIQAYPSAQSDVFGSLNVPSDLLFQVVLLCYEVFDMAFEENARIKNISDFFYRLLQDAIILEFPEF
ncbi:hypothetical protein TKK_0002891 [Trichogramma kaykai]